MGEMPKGNPRSHGLGKMKMKGLEIGTECLGLPRERKCSWRVHPVWQGSYRCVQFGPCGAWR